MRMVLGYLSLGISVVLFLALITFSPADSAIFVSSVQNPPLNMAGPLGVWLASPVILIYGRFAGLLLDFGFFTIGINILIGSKIGRILIKLTMFFISAICLSIILALTIPNASFIDAGMFGIGIASSISAIIHPTVLLVLFSLLLLVTLISTMKLFQFVTFGLAKIIGLVILAPFELFGLVVRKDDSHNDSRELSMAREREELFSNDEQQEPELDENLEIKPGIEPDFLHAPADENSPFKEELAAQNRDDSPDWLESDSGKNSALNEIRLFYDKEIGEPKVPVLNHIHDEIAETPPVIEDYIPEENDPIELDIVPETIEEDEEIAGEADYAEEAIYRTKTEEIPSDEEPEKLITEDEIEKSEFLFPDSQSLEKSFDDFSKAEESQEIEKVSRVIENTFASFKIDIQVSGYSRGPAITRYEIIPPSGLKLKSIVNLTDDLALNLGTRNIRIVAPIGNRSIIGVEVPNKFRRNVVLRDIIESEEYQKTRAKLPLILGKDIAGNIVIEDLTEMPHLLIAGTTGSGKSVYVNSLIGGLVFKRSSEDVKFIFIDPKMVELELYNGIPHLLAPVITNPEEAIAALEWASQEMDRRYKVLSDVGVRNIIDYNKEAKKIKSKKARAESGLEPFYYIVIVIDEFANLMLRLPKETEKIISRIAAMARAVGIHLVVATQRPSVDVVTGIIKANFPSRIAFRVSSQTDARTIMDKAGAEKLLGKGDMLFMTPNFTDMLRIQSPYVSNTDVETLVRELKRNGTADYVIDLEELMTTHTTNTPDDGMIVDYKQDPIFVESLKAAAENGEVSASYLQRRFRIGYNRASRIIEGMEQMKILGPSTGTSKPREVLIAHEDLVNYL